MKLAHVYPIDAFIRHRGIPTLLAIELLSVWILEALAAPSEPESFERVERMRDMRSALTRDFSTPESPEST